MGERQREQRGESSEERAARREQQGESSEERAVATKQCAGAAEQRPAVTEQQVESAAMRTYNGRAIMAWRAKYLWGVGPTPRAVFGPSTSV